MQGKNKRGTEPSTLLVSFLCGSISGLLLALSRFEVELWPISLVALAPFLWTVYCDTVMGAVLSGAALATTFIFVSRGSLLFSSPFLLVSELLVLMAVFVILGVAIHRSKKRLGFDPVFIALLWSAVVYVHSFNPRSDLLWPHLHEQSNLIHQFCSLFGVLLCGFMVALVNAVVVKSLWIATAMMRSGRCGVNRNCRWLLAFLYAIWWADRYMFPDKPDPPIKHV